MIHGIRESRIVGLLMAGILLVVVGAMLRTALLAASWSEVDASVWDLMKVYGIGFLMDVLTYGCLAAPLALIALSTPRRAAGTLVSRWVGTGVYFVMVWLIIFDAAAEWFFWDEFGVRFNFIAVDYLIYAKEVVGNIQQSYPLTWILMGISGVTVVLVALTYKPLQRGFVPNETRRQRVLIAGCYLGMTIMMLLVGERLTAASSSNQYNIELSRNGMASFARAFFANSIDYPHFYITEGDANVQARLRAMVGRDGGEFINDDPYDIARTIRHERVMTRRNIVVITIESLSSDFMGVFGNKLGLTPNLDELSGESLFFTHFYATGTRTVRGLEAIALSLPPTPGASIIKRPGQHDLFTIGSLLRDFGYRTEFIYGGYGYFDNMNGFFDANGFDAIDRGSMSADQIDFANIWGVCDENLYDLTLQRADKAYGENKPFMFLVMTTSNHRPYTYPQKIDIPSGTGRNGAVKYADYAVGQFLARARSKPWFDNTIFVVVADHCANSAGKSELPLTSYAIPCMIYAPSFIPPGRIDAIASQIDLAPTLMGLLDATYVSRFFGTDLLRDHEHRALIGTYQRLGLFNDRALVVLDPKKEHHVYRLDDPHLPVSDEEQQNLLMDAICYYQGASRMLAAGHFRHLPSAPTGFHESATH